MHWLLLASGAGDPAYNMALDEALLLSMPRLQSPALRFYGWNRSAASFGYFQKYGDLEKMTALRPLVRRPTGGGLVPHEADWTYSLAFPTGHEWYALSAIESYERVHQWISTAFGQVGVITELAASCHRTGPGQCFTGFEKFDVLWKGLKIAGAAQRRTRDGLLIQGSVQPGPIKADRLAWENAMMSVSRRFISGPWSGFTSDHALQEKAEQLTREKYSQDHHNRRK